MSNIIIGFSKPKTWKPFAWLIMKGYGIPFDHVYIKLDFPKLDKQVIFQASQTTVNFMSIDIFFNNNISLKEFTVPLEDDSRKALIEFAFDNVGKAYGIKECFGLAWVRINAIFGRKITNPFKDNGKTYVCSELAGYVLNNFTQYKILDDQDDITPLEVYNTLIKAFNGSSN